MKHRALLIAPLALLAAGCQTWGPTWGEVSGTRYHVAVVNRQPTVIEKIDGNSAYPTRPIKIEPGRHVIEVQGVALRPRAVLARGIDRGKEPRARRAQRRIRLDERIARA